MGYGKSGPEDMMVKSWDRVEEGGDTNDDEEKKGAESGEGEKDISEEDLKKLEEAIKADAKDILENLPADQKAREEELRKGEIKVSPKTKELATKILDVITTIVAKVTQGAILTTPVVAAYVSAGGGGKGVLAAVIAETLSIAIVGSAASGVGTLEKKIKKAIAS